MGRLKATEREKSDLSRFSPENMTHKFTPSQQMELARRIAWFWKNGDITKFAREEFKVNVNPQAIAEMRKSETWKPVIEQCREEYIAKCGEVPLFHKRKRLEELQDMYYRFREAGNDKEARMVLQDLRDEAEGKKGDVSFNFTSITHNEFHQMTDEDLIREKRKTIEDLEKIRRMKQLTNQGVPDVVGIEDAQEVEEVEEAGSEEIKRHE